MWGDICLFFKIFSIFLILILIFIFLKYYFIVGDFFCSPHSVFSEIRFIKRFFLCSLEKSGCMAYKKYHYRNGKKYGPYFYESYRDSNGIVRKKYVGNVDPQSDNGGNLKGGKKTEKGKSTLKKGFFARFFRSGEKKEGIVKAGIVKEGIVKKEVSNGVNVSRKFLFSIFLIGVIVFFGIGFLFGGSEDSVVVKISSSVFSPIGKLTGFVVSSVSDEEVVESFDKEIDLEVRKPSSLGVVVVGGNKNKRMEFGDEGVEGGYGVKGNNVRLYFDLLDYSDFVGDVVVEGGIEVEVDEDGFVDEEVVDTGYGAESITGNFVKAFFNFFGLIGRVVGDIGSGYGNDVLLENVDMGEVQRVVSNLSSDELDVIAKSSVVGLEDDEFDVEVNSNVEGIEYKWGYNVKVKDLDFIAKVEVSSEEGISIYDESSLMIGNKLISFSDLVDSGYSVRFEKPVLGMNVSIKGKEKVVDVIIDEVIEVEDGSGLGGITGGVKIIEDSEEDDMMEENVSEDNNGVGNEGNQGVGNGVGGGVEDNQGVGNGVGGGVEDNQGKETGYGKKENKKSGLTGNVIAFLTGWVIGSVEVEDVSYANSISVYIERDFRDVSYVNESDDESFFSKSLVIGKDFTDLDGDGKVSIGDRVYLDPSLIIIPISNAVHLDVNRSYISNIYNETVVQDDVWSEVVNESEYVRATFSEVLDSSKDVSVYVKVVDDCFEGDLNSIIVIEGIEVPCGVYEKKKRIDEIRRLLG